MIFERILAVVACDPHGVMGKNEKLPWHYPEELQHFSNTIGSSPLVMGYRTFLSFPRSYFDQRVTIVFSRRKKPSDQGARILFVSSLTEFFLIEDSFKDLYVVGGAQIYSLFLREKLIKEVILTKIKKSYEGDTFFPLKLLEAWPCYKMQETSHFNIYHYFNPMESVDAYKNV